MRSLIKAYLGTVTSVGLTACTATLPLPRLAPTSIAPTPQASPTFTAQPPTLTPSPVATVTPWPMVKVRTLASIADSHRLDLRLRLDGLDDARQAVQGALNVELETITSARQRRLTISGPAFPALFGSQLPLPSESLSAYFFAEQTFVFVPAFVPICATFQRLPATLQRARTSFSADALLQLFTDADQNLPATFLAVERLDGMEVHRYALDVGRLNALARARGVALTARSGEVWIVQPQGYVHRLQADLSGDLRALGLNFIGDVRLRLDVLDLNRLAPIALPAVCQQPLRF